MGQICNPLPYDLANRLFASIHPFSWNGCFGSWLVYLAIPFNGMLQGLGFFR